MKSMLRILLVPFVALAFAGVASAQGTSSTPSTKSSDTTKSTDTKSSKSSAAKVQRVRGELTAADAKAGTAKVKLKDKELSLSAESQEAKDSLAKVKVGDNVRVAYVEADGKLTMKSISKSKLPLPKSSAPSTSGSTKSSTASDTKPAK
ncbi:MAG TPA: hypothetical protein VL754_08460 [Verrucomicrobiae bacterium]|jgi:Cu/Ag efflux protein CusF|nr:hypothetical protein [Verrucomicrobiae bacterium]